MIKFTNEEIRKIIKEEIEKTVSEQAQLDEADGMKRFGQTVASVLQDIIYILGGEDISSFMELQTKLDQGGLSAEEAAAIKEKIAMLHSKMSSAPSLEETTEEQE